MMISDSISLTYDGNGLAQETDGYQSRQYTRQPGSGYADIFSESLVGSQILNQQGVLLFSTGRYVGSNDACLSVSRPNTHEEKVFTDTFGELLPVAG